MFNSDAKSIMFHLLVVMIIVAKWEVCKVVEHLASDESVTIDTAMMFCAFAGFGHFWIVPVEIQNDFSSRFFAQFQLTHLGKQCYYYYYY